jgi:hypothetical protein
VSCHKETLQLAQWVSSTWVAPSLLFIVVILHGLRGGDGHINPFCVGVTMMALNKNEIAHYSSILITLNRSMASVGLRGKQ